jgi:ADP-ribose pyrophosphatase
MPYRLADKQTVYVGKKLKLEIHHLENEETGSRLLHEVVVHPGAVVILPVHKDGSVSLIRNRRYSIGQVLLELPAGTLEKGEDPMNCAGRELMEETGLIAGRLLPLPSFYSSPGIMTERMYPFVAYDLEEGKRALEEGEDIEVEQFPLNVAVSMCADGRICDGKTIATLLMYERFFRHGKHGQSTAKTDG